MELKLKLCLSLFVLILLYLIIKTIKKNKLSIRYGVLWVFLTIVMEFGIIFSKYIIKVSVFLGFEAASNMILLLLFLFLFYITFFLTLKISKQNHQIKTLIQEVSILKESVGKNERRK